MINKSLNALSVKKIMKKTLVKIQLIDMQTHRFCNEDIDRFVLLLRKGVYPFEHMDSWERFNETSLPDKKAFYS